MRPSPTLLLLCVAAMCTDPVRCAPATPVVHSMVSFQNSDGECLAAQTAQHLVWRDCNQEVRAVVLVTYGLWPTYPMSCVKHDYITLLKRF